MLFDLYRQRLKIEQSSGDPTSIQALAGISQTLLSLIVVDISDDDEEM